jgi:hypothetical protein
MHMYIYKFWHQGNVLLASRRSTCLREAREAESSPHLQHRQLLQLLQLLQLQVYVCLSLSSHYYLCVYVCPAAAAAAAAAAGLYTGI